MSRHYKRITVKIGSNVLTRSDGALDITLMSAIVDQVAELRAKGIEVIIVSSGAVAGGCGELKDTKPKKLDSVERRQLFSAVGQAKLINRYYELFREHHIHIGQVLTMKENFSTRRHYLNQRNCMTALLENGVVPIVNENDTISVTELMFTDNDELSSLIAAMTSSQALIILSNVDGIYNGSPTNPHTKLISEVNTGDDLSQYIQAQKSDFGRGGMLTKSRIAQKTADEGIEVIIANGRRNNILTSLLLHPEETPCTRFVPRKEQVSEIKKWAAHCEDFAKGKIYLNSKAVDVVCGDHAVSILPVGVTRIEGNFEKGDLVHIMSPNGKTLGVGRAAYGSADAAPLLGRHDCKPIVHYDYLYLGDTE